MQIKNSFALPGVKAVLLAALLFGAATPLAKYFLNGNSPLVIAGLLYLGSGIGLKIYRMIKRLEPASLPRAELVWFAGAILAGGIVAPVLLMVALRHMPASSASLLLNAEGVFTALLAWFAFKENFDRRIALGMAAILLGALILSWPGGSVQTNLWPALAVLGACLAWGIDNNLTRKVSLNDASWIASVKGLASGSTNLGLAAVLGATLPSFPVIIGTMTLGFLAYGVSLALFVVALRHLGTSRTGAYFSIAPFFGAMLALLSGDPLSFQLIGAGILMGVGIWLHLTERHEHSHAHEELDHDHEHTHDLHHVHEHANPVAPGVKHGHPHRHTRIEHTHAHFPDVHHRHLH